MTATSLPISGRHRPAGSRQTPVAIVGMGLLFPGAPDLSTYWANLVEGNDAITDAPRQRWQAPPAGTADPTGAPAGARFHHPRGGFVDDLAVAEPERFDIDLDTARTIEPEQLIALQVAAAAIDDAGGCDRLGDPGRIGVVLGRSGYLAPGMARLDQRVRTAQQLVHTLGTLLPELTRGDLERVHGAFIQALGGDCGQSDPAALALVPNLAASRIADRLDLRGPAYTVDAACASSLVAVDAAVTELAAGRCDAMLAGGVHHSHDVTLWSMFRQLGMVSASQRSRPFHTSADGMLLGEGTGIVVLKRLDDALAAGDRIYAVIAGTGIASAGRAASGDTGPALALTRAWAAAGLDPRQPEAIGLIEAHGTGIPSTDLAELTALGRVFGPATPDNRAVIGSVKSMIGHTMAAAGVAGLIKAALAVHHGVLLPTLCCDQPHPAMELTRFRPLPVAFPWVADGPRRAGVSAFGFGGINAHVVLESAPDAPASSAPAGLAEPRKARAGVREPQRVLRFAAPTPGELFDLLDSDDATVRERGADPPEHQGPGIRLGLVGPSERRLAVARRVARGAGPGTRTEAGNGTGNGNGNGSGGWSAWRGRNDVWLSSQPLLSQPASRIAFVFPGLEAEFAPRIDDVADHFGLPRPDLSASSIGQHGSAVLRIGRVLERALYRMGVVPQALAGHSIGEWSAAFAAEVYDEASIDDLVFGSVMDDLAALDVDYASLACSVDQAVEAIADRPEITLSHDNAPRQTIVCGPPAAIRALAAEQRRNNILVQILPFRSGFHTPMLAPYVDEITRRMAALPIQRAPRTELWSATVVGRYPDPAAEIRALLRRHLLEPVRFRPMILAMHEAGVRVFIQVGQGRLAGLIDDTLGHLPHLTIAANTARRSGLDQLRRVAVALWVEGGTPDFEVLGIPNAAPGQPPAPHLGRQLRLDLGARSVALDPAVLPRPAAADPLADSGLAGWARRDPVAAELLDLLTATAHTAVAVLESGPAEPAGQPGSPAEPIRSLETHLRVSVEAMPFLLDHCMTPQRSGWPELADRRPVLPATTIVRMMMDFAEKAAPGRVAVCVSEVRFDRWLPAAPPTDVAIEVRPISQHAVAVRFGDHARAIVRLAPSYPDPQRPVWSTDQPVARPPVASGPELYQRRWLFHGPRFQGIVKILGSGDRDAQAVVTATPAPGSLLDAPGQVLAYFARVNLAERYVIFPGGIDRIDFHGPEPAPGIPVTCLIRVPRYDQDWLSADFQLVVDGRVWAEITGWVSRRFDVRPDTDQVFRFPERHTVSKPMPGGWMLAVEAWSDLASRDMFASRYLGGPERDELARLSPRRRRHWLLGRIAIKDAVRAWLWDAGHGPIFPAQLRVANTAAGVPYVVGEPGLDLPPLRVSVAHSGEAAVAVASPSTDDAPDLRHLGSGIDIEEIREHPPATLDAALSAAEQRLLDDLVQRTGHPGEVWFTRFWTAKEAAGKAIGTGLDGGPRRFVVGRSPTGGSAAPADPDRLVVTTPDGRVLTVTFAQVSNPPQLPPREYVVAWTELQKSHLVLPERASTSGT